VRDNHAAYDDRVFRWDDPPEGGHLGEAHNSRCYAEPVLPGVQSNVVLADLRLRQMVSLLSIQLTRYAACAL
jgi:uncharacterized protein with gpF-like domain